MMGRVMYFTPHCWSVYGCTSVRGSSLAWGRRCPAPRGRRTCSHCSAASDLTSPTICCCRCLEMPLPEILFSNTPPVCTEITYRVHLMPSMNLSINLGIALYKNLSINISFYESTYESIIYSILYVRCETHCCSLTSVTSRISMLTVVAF